MIAAVRGLGFCAILAAVRTVLAARHVGAAIGDSSECASRQGEGEGSADELEPGHDILRKLRVMVFDVTRFAEGVWPERMPCPKGPSVEPAKAIDGRTEPVRYAQRFRRQPQRTVWRRPTQVPF
jgi:hypothetical protein